MLSIKRLDRAGRSTTAFSLVLLVLTPTLGRGQHRTFDVRELTESAGFIVVGQVLSVEQKGATEVEIAGRSFPAKLFYAQVRVDRKLKGTNVPPQTIVRFAQPISPAGSVGYDAIDAGGYGIFFLKRADDYFELDNPFNASLPALPRAPLSSPTDPLTAVIHELAGVVDSPQTADAVKLSVIYRLGSTSTQAVTDVLQRQLTTPNPAIRASVAAALLQHNYMPALPIAQDILMTAPTQVPKYLLGNLASAIAGLKNERAIPSLRILLGASDPQARRAAAFALRNTGSQEAIPALASALADRDSEVRYYAVIGLGEITNQPDWRPLMEDFLAHEKKYIDYWRSWAEANAVKHN